LGAWRQGVFLKTGLSGVDCGLVCMGRMKENSSTMG